VQLTVACWRPSSSQTRTNFFLPRQLLNLTVVGWPQKCSVSRSKDGRIEIVIEDRGVAYPTMNSVGSERVIIVPVMSGRSRALEWTCISSRKLFFSTTVCVDIKSKAGARVVRWSGYCALTTTSRPLSYLARPDSVSPLSLHPTLKHKRCQGHYTLFDMA
jgi:hypothetical protein